MAQDNRRDDRDPRSDGGPAGKGADGEHPSQRRETSEAVAQLTAQLAAVGADPDHARQVATREVAALRYQWPESLDYLVVPHVNGWCVTRAAPANAAETFAELEDAIERARQLAVGAGCGVIVYDEMGQPGRRESLPR